LFWFNSYDENVQTHACNFKSFFYKNPQPHKFDFLGVEISEWSPFMTSNFMQHYIFWMPNNCFIFQNPFQEIFLFEVLALIFVGKILGMLIYCVHMYVQYQYQGYIIYVLTLVCFEPICTSWILFFKCFAMFCLHSL